VRVDVAVPPELNETEAGLRVAVRSEEGKRLVTLAVRLTVPLKPSMLAAVIVAVVRVPVVTETKYELGAREKFGPVTSTSTRVELYRYVVFPDP